jgi:hypothetical protein
MSKSNFVPVGANIKVVGLGGAGCNAITRMVREQIHGVEFTPRYGSFFFGMHGERKRPPQATRGD